MAIYFRLEKKKKKRKKAFHSTKHSDGQMAWAESQEQRISLALPVLAKRTFPTRNTNVQHQAKHLSWPSRAGPSPFPTLQQHGHQRRAVAVLGLLHQQLPVVQDVSDGVAPLDDAVHDVAGIVLLVRAESLDGK